MSDQDDADQPAGRPAGEGGALDDAELRMRRALGLGGRGQAPARSGAVPAMAAQAGRGGRQWPDRRKHRYVQDGEVPVEIVTGMRERSGTETPNGGEQTSRLEAAERLAASEHVARDRVEQELRRAQAVIHDLRTKLAHAELAQQEAQAAAAVLAAELAALRPAEAPPAPRKRGRPRKHPLPIPAAPAPAPKRRGRPAALRPAAEIEVEIEVTDDDQPIEWWLTPAKPAKQTRRRRAR